MKQRFQWLAQHGRAVAAVCTAAVLLFLSFCVWLIEVKDTQGKTRSAYLNDWYEGNPVALDAPVRQSFRTEREISAIGTVFYNTAELDGSVTCRLYDEQTGALLASASRLGRELPAGQYAMFTFAQPCAAGAFAVEFSADPSSSPAQIGCSRENRLPGCALTVGGEARLGTIPLRISFDCIGGFASRMFWWLAVPLALLAGAMVWLSGKKQVAVHRLYLAAALVLGLLYNAVLPPYASPDEMFHINQAFNNSSVVLGGVERSEIDWGENFKRPSDQNELVQDRNTTVFTYREIAQNLFSASPDAAADTAQFAQEEVGGFNLLYLFSSLGVLLGRLLGLGFVPTLMLGRLFNFAFYLALTTWAVRVTPVGRSCFAVTALLPMSLHLAMSFNRDCVLLALAFCFTAYCFSLAYGERRAELLGWKQLAPLGLLGVFLAPSKVVYLPLCFLFLLIPGERFGDRRRARLCRAVLAACMLAPYLLTSSAIGVALSFVRGLFSSPEAVQAASDAAANAVGSANPDAVVYSVPYMLGHLKDTLYLAVRTFVENSSFYLRTLLGDSLGYYSVPVDSVWLMGLSALVAVSALDSQGSRSLRPGARVYGLFLSAVVFCLVTLGCILWTPTYYTTIYGIQGRYLLPVFPLLLACVKPASLSLNREIGRPLICAACLLQTGVILNVFLVVLAR